MKKCEVIAISALGEKTRAIGKDNKLLWKIPGDLSRFREITMGHPVIMGYKTFVSMGEKPLPGRTNIVLSRNKNLKIKEVTVAHSKEEALEIAKNSAGSEEIYIIGGGQVYELLLADTDILDLTLVYDNTDGDTFFPEYSEFSETVWEEHNKDGNLKFARKKLKRALR